MKITKEEAEIMNQIMDKGGIPLPEGTVITKVDIKNINDRRRHVALENNGEVIFDGLVDYDGNVVQVNKLGVVK